MLNKLRENWQGRRKKLDGAGEEAQTSCFQLQSDLSLIQSERWGENGTTELFPLDDRGGPLQPCITLLQAAGHPPAPRGCNDHVARVSERQFSGEGYSCGGVGALLGDGDLGGAS